MSRFPICLLLLTGLSPGLRGQPQQPSGAEGLKKPAPSVPLGQLGTARFQNGGQVFSVAYSPDGKLLAAGSWDGSVRLWEVATGKEVRQFVGHKGWVSAVAFAPDGQTLATGGKDRDVHLWEAATGKPLRQLTGHQDRIAAVVFSPDGKSLASNGHDGTLRLWEVAAGRELRQIGGKSHSPACPAVFSPNGKTLVSTYQVAVRQGVVCLWDVATGKEVQRFTELGEYPAEALALSPDGKTLAAGRWGGEIRLWDVSTGKDLAPLKSPDPNNYWFSANFLAFSPDGKTLASGGSDNTIRVWELATRQERCRFQSPDNGAMCFAFSPDGRVLASGSGDITVLLWDVTGRTEQGRLQPVKLAPEEMPDLWAALAGNDAAKAHRALWKLVAGAAQSVPWFEKQLRPVPPADPKQVAAWIADLESEEFAARQKATAELEKWESAQDALMKVLAGQPSLEMRRRVEQVLQTLTTLTPERLRLQRAIEALEQIGSPEARKLLKELAQGAPSTLLTDGAKSALERLERRRAP
jgi:dipeptidyl aminopeptidase/acylaminoacyl peptidase